MRRFDWYYYAKIIQRVLWERDPSLLALFGFPKQFKGMRVVYDRPDHRYEIRNQLFDAYVVRSYMRHMQQMPERPIVFDLGASYGIIAAALRQTLPKTQLTLFEPNPHAFAYLRNYFDVNNIKDIVVNNVAVGSQDDVLTLYINPHVWETANAQQSYSEEMQAFDVPSVQLSRYLQEHDVPRIDFLKMDIEGAEWDVFSDLDQFGWLEKISCIAMEVHCFLDRPEQQPEVLVNLLERAGHEVTLRKTGNDTYQQRYLLWSHRT